MNDFETVVLTENLPEYKLKSGDVGTIVHTHDNGEAFIVEFITYGGNTVAVVTLTSDQIRPAQKTEMPHVRALA